MLFGMPASKYALINKTFKTPERAGLNVYSSFRLLSLI